MCMFTPPPSPEVAAFEDRMRTKYGITTTLAPDTADPDEARRASLEAEGDAAPARAKKVPSNDAA